jgi:putative membrane protein
MAYEMQYDLSPGMRHEVTLHKSTHELARELVAGGLGGLIATAPMTLAMKLLQRRLPWRERHSLPPRKITAELLRRVGMRASPEQPRVKTAALGSHYAYGAAAGSLYGPLAARLPLPPVVSGVLYGALVWLASYAGLLPLLGLYPPPQLQARRRNLLMIAAHLVWGASLGLAASGARALFERPASLRAVAPRALEPRRRTSESGRYPPPRSRRLDAEPGRHPDNVAEPAAEPIPPTAADIERERTATVDPYLRGPRPPV